MSKKRMISNELMMALIKYHVLDMKDNEEINNLIIFELEETMNVVIDEMYMVESFV